MNFQLNHSILRKEGWAFRDSQNLKIGKDLQNHSCGQKKRKKKCSQNQVDFTHFSLDMNKTNDEIYQEVLRDISQRFEGIYKTDNSGNMRPKKISVEEVIYFLYTKACVFLVIASCKLNSSIKNSCLICNKRVSKA